jgi:multidrug efflux pump subunit AcrB
MHERDLTPHRGPIAWMVRNPVAANLLMLVLLVGGYMMASQIRQEVFPEFDLDAVTVTVPYPGASPEEVEQGVILAVEEAVRGIDGIKDIRSSAREHAGVVTLEVRDGEDPQVVYQDVQQAVARITTFPLDAERAQVAVAAMAQEVLKIQLYGDVSEWVLREHAEAVRDRLLQAGGISQVEFSGARNYEIQVSVPQYHLRAYGLSLSEIAERIRRTAVDVAGGAVDTRSGEILLRLRERREWAADFAAIPIITTADGSVIRLGDIAQVRDGFVENNDFATYNGQRSIGIDVFRVGKQTPIGVSEQARHVLQELEVELPPALRLAIHNDRSEIYQQRLQLLLKNAAIGLLLVMLVLGLFLEARLAFWVTMGIPISFLGAFLVLPGLDVTINMISLFAFILALGIVVDDAIVAGENMYEHRQRGDSLATAAIKGAREVAVPITFSILSNVAAFLPLLLVPGTMGKVFGVIPLVVITVFLISWIEALFVLPAHLAYRRGKHENRLLQAIGARQQAFSRGFTDFVNRYYAPFVDGAVRQRYLTTALGVAVLVIVLGYAASGRMGFSFMPTVESDFSVVTVSMPYGSPLSEMTAARDRLESAAQKVAAANGGDALLQGVFAQIRENNITMTAYLTGPDERPISTGRFTREWRAAAGELPGAESQQFQSDFGGPGSGPAVSVELSHRDTEVLDRAARALAAEIEQFEQTRDVDPGTAQGKPQLDFTVTAAGRSLGLSSEEIGRQVRAAFQGAEALRQQRGRNEITVAVRLPEAERSSEYDVTGLLIRSPGGHYVPLREVARVHSGRAFTEITRRDGRRTVRVTASVEPPEQASQITAALSEQILPELLADYPGLTYRFAGRQADLRDSMRSLQLGFLSALLLIYVLLAVPFRSYLQPVIVMIAIPFGVVGAILGHLIMGYSLSVISVMGVVALSGVVVNGSLVLIHYANQLRTQEGMSALAAIRQAGVRRFRPILLTTLTTFGGLAPMIFETSIQARFMIPMAISLGFGILFASLITLILVPSFYMIAEDLKALVGRRETAAKRLAGADADA